MNIEASFSSLAEILMNSAKDETGITFIESEKDESFLSYGKLYDKAAYVLFNLQKSGLKPGDELVFQFQYNKNFVITFWACILGKIIPVPITFGSSEEIMLKLANVWKLLNNPYLITDFTGFKDAIWSFEAYIDDSDIVSSIRDRTIYFEDVNVIYKKAGPIPSGLDDIAFIQYSSGSTGNPKGVINTHKGLIYNIYSLSEFFKITSKERILSWMPLTHDMGLILFHILPLFNSAHQYLIPPILFLSYPWLWMAKASDRKITITGSPNFGFKYYLDYYDEKTLFNRSLEYIKIIFNAAEPISFEICEQFVQTLAKYKLNRNTIRPAYGLAEATLGVSTIPLSDEFSEHFIHRDYLNVGDKVQFVDPQNKEAVSFVDLGIFPFTSSVKITDEAGKQLPDQTLGHIEITGPCVTGGYYNDPVTTSQMFSKDGWLDTGDLGYIYNQRLVIVGRSKEIIIINGQNYYPLDLERVAETLAGIEPGKITFTSVFNSKMHSEEVLGFVVFRQVSRDIKEFVSLAVELKIHFIDKLGIEVHQIIPVEKIPVTTSGKIQRLKLKKDYLEGKFAAVLEEIARLEEKITAPGKVSYKTDIKELVKEICGDRPGRETWDNFFKAGVDSLKAMSFAARIRRRFNVNIPIGIFFEKPTIEGIAQYIRNAEKSICNSIDPSEKKEYYAAAVGQKKLFVLSEMERIDLTLNIFGFVTLEGPLDKQRFEESFLALIKRQESLRTSFHTIEGEIVMKIHKTDDVDFAMEYVRLQESENQENELQEIITQSGTLFDLAQPPLLKLKLVKLAKDKHMMLLDIHHIIADDTSMRLLLNEVSALYKGEELPVLRMGYKDYAQWQQKFMESEEFKKLEDYWLKRFSRDIPLLDMLTDYKRPDMQTFEGEWIRFSLEEELVREIRRAAEDSRATLYMILLAALNILLSRYTGQEDITIASPVIGRDYEGLENIIGLFINLLPMRNFPKPHKTFSEFLGEVRENALTAYENQAFPFGNLVEKLGIQEDYSRNPLNDVELIMVHTDVSMLEIEGLRSIPYEYDMNTTMVDIILEVTELAEKLSFKLMYCTKLFKRETMERFINSFKEILAHVMEDKNILLEDIAIDTQLSEAKPVFKYNEGDFHF